MRRTLWFKAAEPTGRTQFGCFINRLKKSVVLPTELVESASTIQQHIPQPDVKMEATAIAVGRRQLMWGRRHYRLIFLFPAISQQVDGLCNRHNQFATQTNCKTKKAIVCKKCWKMK
jgi:hypothetical protein